MELCHVKVYELKYCGQNALLRSKKHAYTTLSSSKNVFTIFLKIVVAKSVDVLGR